MTHDQAIARVRQMLPLAGDRVGFRDCFDADPAASPGTVLAVYSDEWASTNALILMDSGCTINWSAPYSSVGIGCYLLRRAL